MQFEQPHDVLNLHFHRLVFLLHDELDDSTPSCYCTLIFSPTSHQGVGFHGRSTSSRVKNTRCFHLQAEIQRSPVTFFAESDIKIRKPLSVSIFTSFVVRRKERKAPCGRHTVHSSHGRFTRYVPSALTPAVVLLQEVSSPVRSKLCSFSRALPSSCP